MATIDHSSVPALPPFAAAALYFLRSGDFLFTFQAENDERSRAQLVKEGAKFVTVNDVQAAFSGRDVDTSWIAPGVVRCGYCSKGDWFVYAAGPQVIPLQVILGDDKGLKKIKVPIPATVMVGVGMQYYLFAMANPYTPDTRLFRAPFPNIHDDGAICWGQNTPPKAHHRNARTAWQLFFESQFNGDLANGKSEKYESDVRRMMAYVSRKKFDSWPVTDMIQSRGSLRYTVHDIVGASEES